MKFSIDEIIDIKVNGVKINTEPISSKEFFSKEKSTDETVAKFDVGRFHNSCSFTVENVYVNLGVLIEDLVKYNSIEDTVDYICSVFKEPCKYIGIKIPTDYCKNCNNNIRECWKNVIENKWYEYEKFTNESK